MGLVDLLTDLSNFRYTDYGNAGSVQSQLGGRHGTVDAPIDNTDFDNGVGFGIDPNSTPQSFNVRGYQITGNKRFIINYGGDILDNNGSLYGLGEFEHTAGIGGGVAYYGNLLPITPRNSIYSFDGEYQVPQEGENTLPPGGVSGIRGFNGVQRTLNIPQINLTGPFNDSYQSELNTQPVAEGAHGSDYFTSPITSYTSQFSLDNLNTAVESGFDRGSMYISNIDEPNTPIFKQFTRGDVSLKRITLTSPNFNPFVFGTGLPYVIPQHTSTGPTQFTIGEFSDEPLIPNLHGSSFTNTPPYTSQIQTDTSLHLMLGGLSTGPVTTQDQTISNVLQTTPIADNAHGSDFLTSPISAFSSRFANQDGMLMDSVFVSGFSSDKFYVGDSNRGPTDSGTFKDFGGAGQTPLKTIDLNSPNFDSNDNRKYFDDGKFKDRLPYNIPARDDSTTGFDQPFILRPIGNTWGLDNPEGDGFFAGVGGFLSEIDSAAGDIVRGAPGFTGLVSRTLHDAVRLGKFMLTPKGIFFLAKQAGLQLLNPREETRIYNPLSLASISPIVHMNRHLSEGDFGYDQVTRLIGQGMDFIMGGEANSPLGSYTKAIESGIPFDTNWGTGTAKRTTLAHLAAMVPGRGGKMTLGALPELKFDLTRGTIESLSPNTFPNTDGNQNTIPNSNKYKGIDTFGDSRYAQNFSDGNIGAKSILPIARNRHHGLKLLPGGLATRFGGSQFVDNFLNEDGLFPSLAITDAVERTDVFKISHQPYSTEFPYSQEGGDTGFKNIGLANQDFELARKTTVKDPEAPAVVRQSVIFSNIGDPLNDQVEFGSTPYKTVDTLLSPFVSQGENQYGQLLTYKEQLSQVKDGYIKLGTDSPSVIKYYNHLNTQKSADTTKVLGKTIVHIYDPFKTVNTGFESGPFKYFYDNGQGLNKGDTTTSGYIKRYHDALTESSPSVSDRYENIILANNKFGKIAQDSKKNPTITINSVHRDESNFPGVITDEPRTLQSFPIGEDIQGRTGLNSYLKNEDGVQGKSIGNLYGAMERKGHGLGKVDSLVDKVKRYTNKTGDRILSHNRFQPNKEPNTAMKVRQGRKDSSDFSPQVHEVNLSTPGEVATVDGRSQDGLFIKDLEAKSITNSGIHHRGVKGAPESKAKGKDVSNIDRYKVLSYGELPDAKDITKTYTQRVLDEKGGDANSKTKKPIPPLMSYTKDGSTITIAPKFGGIVKQNRILNQMEKQNLVKYGEGDVSEVYGDDYIRFQFYDLNNKKSIVFPAILSGIGDSVTPEYSSEKYIGRPDKVHTYIGADREISFSFNVAATSKQDLIVLWEKMNYLVGLCYPNWKKISDSNRMDAPFITLTIGDMYDRMPGFLQSLSFTVNDQSTWDIDEGYQLPKVMDVECTFTHIGKHILAQQGVHFDLPWLKKLNYTDGNYVLQNREVNERFGSSDDFTDVLGS